MKFYFVPYHIVKDKIQSIVEENKEDFQKHYGDVEVDYAHFETLSALGMAFVALAIKDDVIGFAGFVVNHNATDKEVEAENVVMWFDKHHRGKYFKDLIDFAKGEFVKMGVHEMVVTIKSDGIAKLLKANDFTKKYETWAVNCE